MLKNLSQEQTLKIMGKNKTSVMFVHQPGEHLTLLWKGLPAEFLTLFFFLLFTVPLVFHLFIKLCLFKLLDGHFTSKFWPTGFWLAVCCLHSEYNKSGILYVEYRYLALMSMYRELWHFTLFSCKYFCFNLKRTKMSTFKLFQKI